MIMDEMALLSSLASSFTETPRNSGGMTCPLGSSALIGPAAAPAADSAPEAPPQRGEVPLAAPSDLLGSVGGHAPVEAGLGEEVFCALWLSELLGPLASSLSSTLKKLGQTGGGPGRKVQHM